MILSALKTVALAGLLLPAAARFPEIDIAKLCSGVSVFGPRDKALSVCRRTEGEARDHLRALWPTLEASDKSVCLGGAELGVAVSYVDIAGCIDMSRELRREKSLPPKASVPPQ